MRKCAVLAASVFLVSFGAETQALAGMMICMVSLIFHLHWKPFIPVAPGRNTLFWAEFWALFVAFLTFWTGLFFFQAEKPWWNKSTSRGFAIELITVNVMYMILSMRWYMILKLMDTSDLIMTKELQGADEKDLKGAKSSQRFLKMFVPEWKVIQNLWAKKAWQTTIKHQIMANRSLRAMGALENLAKDAAGEREILNKQKSHRKSYSTSAQRELHDNALAALGLGAHREAKDARKKKKEKEEAKRKRREKRRASFNRFTKKKEKVPEKKRQSNEHVKGPMEVMEDAERARKQQKIREQHQLEKATKAKEVLRKEMISSVRHGIQENSEEGKNNNNTKQTIQSKEAKEVIETKERNEAEATKTASSESKTPAEKTNVIPETLPKLAPKPKPKPRPRPRPGRQNLPAPISDVDSKKVKVRKPRPKSRLKPPPASSGSKKKIPIMVDSSDDDAE